MARGTLHVTRRYPNAATPGKIRPPRNSSDAPPPVEMCVILSVTPALATAAIESPRPKPLYAVGSAAPLAFTAKRLLSRGRLQRVVARRHGLAR